jgi:hypothetical protein
VNRESFRRELRRAFDNMAGPPSSSLPDRVRSALNEPYQERAPIWVAGLAAALIAAIVIGVLVVIHPFNRQPLVSVGQPSPSPSPSASPSPSLPAFDCGSAYRITSAGAPAVAEISAVRTGTHAGYDRITIEFKGELPATINLRTQNGATFIQDASGQPVTLKGSYGLLVIIDGADAHTAYSGPYDFKPPYAGLLEARQTGDFEGKVQWGLGLAQPACYRAFILTNPNRLVVDIQVP